MVGNRKTKKRDTTDVKQRAVDARAEWLFSHMKVDPTLIGRWGRMRMLVQDHFKISRKPADETIAKAYELLDEDGKKLAPYVVRDLIEKTRMAFEIAAERNDARGMCAAIDLARRITGIGEDVKGTAVNVNVSAGMSGEDRELLDALRLTPAQRANEVKKLEAELAAAEPAVTQ